MTPEEEAAELLRNVTRVQTRWGDTGLDREGVLTAVAAALRARDERIKTVVSERDVVRCTLDQARERIAALTQENERLRAALSPFAEMAGHGGERDSGSIDALCYGARAALAGRKP